MARPFLADPDLLLKAREGRVEDINTCIGCNQACLDHTFQAKQASCLVNPRSGYESELQISPLPPGAQQRLAVVGAGPAGLAFATVAASRGHDVTLYDSAAAIGGQFNLAKRIPGKEEFFETIRYFGAQLRRHKVHVNLNTRVSADQLSGYDQVVLATGIVPRRPRIKGIDASPMVMSYVDLLTGRRHAGKRVAIIGAGGIGFDVAEFLVHDGHKTSPTGVVDGLGVEPVPSSPDLSEFLQEWGIDETLANRGGVAPPSVPSPRRSVFLLQRKTGKVGAGLGKTTGWIHRAGLKARGVESLSAVDYLEITPEGLRIAVPGRQTAQDKSKAAVGKVERLLEVDSIVICAGQEPERALVDGLKALGVPTHLIGGAERAGELDAKRAIDQGTRLAACVETARPGQVFEAPVGLGAHVYQFVASRLGAA